MIKIDDKEIKRYECDLKTFANRAYPFATKQTVNRSAFTAQKIARNDIRGSMTLRNKFSVQSIQVDQARTLKVSRQTATVGSIAGYMEDQEFGATKSKKGKEGVAIATSYAAGQSQNARPRTRLPRKPNQLANIKLQRRRKRGSNRRQQNLIAIKQAAEGGRKYVFLDLGRRKGIFKVVGGRRRPKIKMVHDLTRQSVKVPKNPWLAPAVAKTEALIPAIYRDSLAFQLKRLRLFK
jgi:hypothetical protein